MSNSSIKWVALPAVQGKVYADMVMEVLQQHEIPCHLKSFYGSGALGVISGAGMAGANDKIMVPEELYPQAVEILDDMVDHL